MIIIKSKYCDPAFVELFLDLASSTPVSALVALQDLSIIDQLISQVRFRADPVQFKELESKFPSMALFLEKRNLITLPRYAEPLLQKMKEIVERSRVPPHADEQAGEESSLSFFPSLPIRRHRGRYECDQTEQESNSTGECTKHYPNHRKLIPGIFTLFCQHGVCLGFEVMRNAESPNIPFGVMKSRLLKAPKVVVYDNACHLHSYCLNRDPGFFRDTKFVIDRFHTVNHTDCSSGYVMDRYRQLAFLNSQVTEQVNSGLSKLKSHLSFMTQENFLAHVKLFLFLRNERHLLEMNRS